MKLKKVRNMAVAGAITLGVLTVVFFLVSEFISNYFVRNNMDSIDAPGSGARLLVFAPITMMKYLEQESLLKRRCKTAAR